MEVELRQKISRRAVKVWRKINKGLPLLKIIKYRVGEAREEKDLVIFDLLILLPEKEVRGKIYVGKEERGRRYVRTWFDDGSSCGFYVSLS